MTDTNEVLEKSATTSDAGDPVRDDLHQDDELVATNPSITNVATGYEATDPTENLPVPSNDHASFKTGDTVLMDETQVQITSWPATNAGFFSWVRYGPGGSETRGTDFYGETSEGAPTTASKQLTLIREGEHAASTLPEIDVPIERVGNGEPLPTMPALPDPQPVPAD